MATLINLRKAVAGKLWWENQHGHRSDEKPERPTLFGRTLGDETVMGSPERVADAASRTGRLDVWTPHFKVPHPRMCMRTFVLIPANEVAPDLIDPVTGWSIGHLRKHLEDAGRRSTLG